MRPTRLDRCCLFRNGNACDPGALMSMCAVITVTFIRQSLAMAVRGLAELVQRRPVPREVLTERDTPGQDLPICFLLLWFVLCCMSLRLNISIFRYFVL